MRETWYVMEDGNVADPNDVVTDDAGVLRHKDGAAVALRNGVPHSRGVDVDEPGIGKKTADMKSEPVKAEKSKPGYKTRSGKAA